MKTKEERIREAWKEYQKIEATLSWEELLKTEHPAWEEYQKKVKEIENEFRIL